MFLDKKSCAKGKGQTLGSIFKGDIDGGFYRVCWLFYRKNWSYTIIYYVIDAWLHVMNKHFLPNV